MVAMDYLGCDESAVHSTAKEVFHGHSGESTLSQCGDPKSRSPLPPRGIIHEGYLRAIGCCILAHRTCPDRRWNFFFRVPLIFDSVDESTGIAGRETKISMFRLG